MRARKRPVYKCQVCSEEKAVLRYILVTRTKKFRAKYHCPSCGKNFEVTIGGKNWKIWKYPKEEVLKEINIIITCLIKEKENE